MSELLNFSGSQLTHEWTESCGNLIIVYKIPNMMPDM